MPKWPKGSVCKTVIRRFESARHLQLLPRSCYHATMISSFLATVLFQTPATDTIADQTLKITFGATGTLGSPLGEIVDPVFIGDFKITNGKELSKERSVVQVQLKLKRTQTKLVEALTNGFEEKKEADKLGVGLFRVKDFAYITNDIVLDKKEAKLDPMTNSGDFSAGEVLNPLSLSLAIFQRSLLNPQLRKEFFLMKDGPREYYATFMPNLNANTDASKGEVAYKFNLKLKEENGEFPQFFMGAIRLNAKTRLLTYLNASSEYKNTPSAGNTDETAFHDIQNIAIKIEAKEVK